MDQILAAVGVHKRFGALVVLDGVDFGVAAGEAVGIVGPNGAGKTTLLNVLAGSLRPGGGRVELAGADVTKLGAAHRCRLGLGRVHQVPRPFGGMTVFENVFVGAATGGGRRGTHAYERCIDALELSGLADRANRRAETLGLLDRKRLELARALATDPRVLLLDEIGGGLGESEMQDIVEVLRAVRARGVAIVWIEHIVHALRSVVDRLIAIDVGRTLMEGSPDAVM